jgi:mono/diheme cytochrome c family protein
MRVNPCLAVQRIARLLLRTGPLLCGLVLLSGCESEYPADYKYPLRTDPLVTQAPKEEPARLDWPGEFPSQVLTKLTDEKDKINILSPEKLDSKVRGQLEAALEKHFGTPRAPKVDGIADDIRTALKLDAKTLAEGSVAYRANCLHCHGLTGNGRGPTAPWVNPHPRDYRQGIFKFTSINSTVINPATGKEDPALGGNVRKPRREDLLRTLREGIESTSMPSFSLLSESELQALVSYVIHLSMRGDVEYTLMQLYLKGIGDEDFQGQVNDTLEAIANRWLAAGDPRNVIRPDPAVKDPINKSGPPDGALLAQRKESAKRGYELFSSSGAAGCIGCHKDYGRQSAYFYDSWGTIGRAADLTTGVYRGGRRPIDFYWRIHSGVPGSSMPAFFDALKPSVTVLDLLANDARPRRESRQPPASDEERKNLEEVRRLEQVVKAAHLSDEETRSLASAFSKAPEGVQSSIRDKLATQQLWDLVNFAQFLPYPSMRKEIGVDIDRVGGAPAVAVSSLGRKDG